MDMSACAAGWPSIPALCSTSFRPVPVGSIWSSDGLLNSVKRRFAEAHFEVSKSCNEPSRSSSPRGTPILRPLYGPPAWKKSWRSSLDASAASNKFSPAAHSQSEKHKSSYLRDTTLVVVAFGVLIDI